MSTENNETNPSQSDLEGPVERRVGSAPNGEGVSIIVKYYGLNLDIYLTVSQAKDLIASITKSAPQITGKDLFLIETEGKPN